MRKWLNLIEDHAREEEALWWVERYVTGSMTDPDWDYGSPTHHTLLSAFETVGRMVGNQQSIGQPLRRGLFLDEKEINQIEGSMILNPTTEIQSFSQAETEDVREIVDEIGFYEREGTLVVVTAMIQPNDILFGMEDLKNSSGEAKQLYYRLDDWHHQREVFVRPIPVKLLEITKFNKK